MITSEGKLHLKRYLAGYEPDIGRALAFGVGTTPATLADMSLQYEVGRSPVNLVAYDFVTDQLIFKAVLNEQFDAVIHEVGLYSREDSSAGAFGSRIISSFDSDTELWMVGGSPSAYTIENTRIGNDSATVSINTSSNVTLSLGNIAVDFSENSAADVFSFAFYCADANLSSIRYRFLTDASNYYDVTVPSGSIAAGFNIVPITKGSAVVTGTPNWGAITELQVTLFAKASGTAVVNLEGIRIEDTDTVDTGYVLVARVVLDVPFVKVAGRIQEIQFPLGVNI